MFCHWNYVLEGILGRSDGQREDRHAHPDPLGRAGQPYAATADDAAYGIFEIEGGIVAQINSSWAVRVYRDELVEFQIDGTHGSAVAGLNKCVAQQRAAHPEARVEPRPAGHRVVPRPVARGSGQRRPGQRFKLQWEEFLRDVVAGRTHRFGLLSAARGVQLAELGLRSSAEGRRLEIPEITL